MKFRKEYSFLSNFHNCKIQYQNETWTTAEHAFQAAKALNGEDVQKILNAATPVEAKRLGNIIVRCADWKDKQLETMREIVLAKFDQNILLMRKLLNTWPTYIEEENMWHDNFWGNCCCPQCVGKFGLNHLGKILMQIREDRICYDEKHDVQH
jgi:hypothetical protein